MNKKENKTNIATVVTTADAMILVEKGEGKFLSYGYDQQFFFLYNGGTYAHRDTEKTYTILRDNSKDAHIYIDKYGGNKNESMSNVPSK